MIRTSPPVAAAIVAVAALALSTPAASQTFTFQKTFRAPAGTDLSVTTERGRITVHRGESDGIVVNGRVSVRTGFNVPVKAPEYARATADNPPVQQTGSSVKLEIPGDPAVRASVTIEYDVEVPAATRVTAVSQSGAVTIAEVAGPISVRTQSSTVLVTHAGSTAQIRTGSGAVTVNGAARDLQVTTESGAIRVDEVSGGLTVQTGSGHVAASLVGEGDVDVHTRSSAVDLRGAGGGLTASTESGHLTIAGRPRRPWSVTTGSGAIDVTFDASTAAELTASTSGGSVEVAAALTEVRLKEQRRVAGRVGAGGPAVTLTSRSATIKVAR